MEVNITTKSALYVDYCNRISVLEYDEKKRFQEADTARTSGNHPTDFETLKPAEQDVLLYWITQVMVHSDRYDKQTSYGMKHNFEGEAFYITNGMFKGAMLMLEYAPKDESALNWEFKVKPCIKRSRITRRYYETLSDYELYRLPKFDPAFAGLLLRTKHLTIEDLLKEAEKGVERVQERVSVPWQ